MEDQDFLISFLRKGRKLFVKKITIAFIIIRYFSACSSDLNYECQSNDNESYLNATPLNELHLPNDLTFPTKNKNFNVPITNKIGDIGKSVNICPPKYHS